MRAAMRATGCLSPLFTIRTHLLRRRRRRRSTQTALTRGGVIENVAFRNNTVYNSTGFVDMETNYQSGDEPPTDYPPTVVRRRSSRHSRRLTRRRDLVSSLRWLSCVVARRSARGGSLAADRRPSLGSRDPLSPGAQHLVRRQSRARRRRRRGVDLLG